MKENKKVILTGIIFIAILVLVLVVYYFLIYSRPKEAPPVQEVLEEKPAQVPSEKPVSEEEKEIPELISVELDKSDEFVRNLAKELSSHPKLVSWLVTKDLVRKFTAAVDNIANGLSPRPQIDFFIPKDYFKIVEKGGSYYEDPSNYDRYNAVADVFLSLNAKRCASFYRQLKPLIQEAYQDLGYPEEDFHKTLTRAIVELLKVPVVDGDIVLVKKVITYMMANPELENLSQAQKHLLRMGPENVRIIQEKLREIAIALEIPESQLPRSKVFSADRR